MSLRSKGRLVELRKMPIQLSCALIICLLTCLPGCYLTKLAYRHNNLFNSRRLLSEVLEDPTVSLKVKERLRYVGRVISFAKKEGLATNGAYRYVIETSSDAVSYIVQAAYPDRLESKTWWFPIVGSVPYKGFFSEEDRDLEADKLKELGFDTNSAKVGAFSSLGWFEDPLYSSMLKRSDIRLAALLFHELAHRSFWIEGEAAFNENLATFIENELVESFFSKDEFKLALEKYKGSQADEKRYRHWLVELKKSLKKLYSQVDFSEDPVELKRRKQEVFAKYTTGQMKPDFSYYDYVGRREWNNATVLAASLYSPDLDRFKKAMQCAGSGTVGDFLRVLKQRSESHSSAFAALDSLCL